MDCWSSDELTSDSELEDIIENAWNKTKVTFKGSKSGKRNSKNSKTKSQIKHIPHASESESLFVIDNCPSQGLSTALSHRETDATNVSQENERFTVGDSNDVNCDSEDDSEPSSFVPTLKNTDKRSVKLFTDYKGSDKHNDDESKKFNQKEERVHETKTSKQHHKRMELSSSIQVNWDPTDIYLNLHSIHGPKPKFKSNIERLSKDNQEIMKKSVVTPDFERKDTVPTDNDSRRHRQKEKKKEREKTTGKGWNNMPIGYLNEERKNDLLALKMRRALDPKRFYKADDIKGLPKYFQFGTVVEDASEFYSARIPKKQRKKSIVEELMADADFRKFNKRKYSEVQDLKSKGLGPYKGIKTARIPKKKKKK